MKVLIILFLGFCLAAHLAGAEESVREEATPAAAVSPSSSLKKDAVPAVEQLAALLEQYGLTLDTEAARRAAVSAMVKSADVGGRWLSEEDRAALEDRLSGMANETGARIRAAVEGPKVIEVVTGSPAAEAGLKAGDRLEAIDGGVVTSLKDWEVRRLLQGPAETRIRVRFLRGAETQEVEVATAPLRQSSVASAEDLPGGIGYLRLNGLYDGASKEVIPALRGWDATNYCGIVLDLRGAGGTNLASVADVTDLFAPEGALLFTLRTAQDQDIQVFRAPGGSAMDNPVMVLTDGDTEGAAEALASVFANSLRGAMLLGGPTRGDPGVREIIACPGGGYLYLAARRLVMADGLVLDGRQPLTPDVVVEEAAGKDYEPEPDKRGRLVQEEQEHRQLRDRVRGDPALRRATDILLALKALNLRGQSAGAEVP